MPIYTPSVLEVLIKLSTCKLYIPLIFILKNKTTKHPDQCHNISQLNCVYCQNNISTLSLEIHQTEIETTTTATTTTTTTTTIGPLVIQPYKPDT